MEPFFVRPGKEGKAGVVNTSTVCCSVQACWSVFLLNRKTISLQLLAQVSARYNLSSLTYRQLKLGLLFCGTQVGRLSAPTASAHQVLNEVPSSFYTAEWPLILRFPSS